MHLDSNKQAIRLLTFFAVATVMSIGACAIQAQTYTFQPSENPLQQAVEISIAVAGKVKMKSARFGVIEEDVQVAGKQSYEQWMKFQRATRLCRAIRYYSHVQSDVTIGKGRFSPELRNSRKLIVDQYQLDHHRLYSPQGTLTRDELDLVDTQLSPTLFYQLLPAVPVDVGDQWGLESSALSAMLALDAVAQNDVKATLQGIEGQQASIVCQGDVAGGVNGVLTQIQLTIQAVYHMPSRSFTKVSLDMTERREIGHAKPGLDVHTKVIVQTRPLEKLATLTEPIVEKCDRPVTGRDELLSLIPVSDAIELELSRDWHVMMDQPDLLVMRQVIRGELVSQCSLSRLEPLSNDKRMSTELLKQQIQKSLGDQLAEFTETTQQPLRGEHPYIRISAVGLVGDITFQWVYHHVTDKTGNQYLFVFTIPNEKVAQFGQQDHEVVNSFVFRAESGKKPVPASASTGTTKR